MKLPESASESENKHPQHTERHGYGELKSEYTFEHSSICARTSKAKASDVLAHTEELFPSGQRA